VVAIASGFFHNLALFGNGPPFLMTRLVEREAAVGTSVSMLASATGARPLHYQWRLNGVNLLGATNAILTLNDFQPGMAGNYSVVVSNLLGVAVSAETPLTPVPLLFQRRPYPQVTWRGAPVSFGVTPAGVVPFAYQWHFNGLDLPGETNATLAFGEVRFEDAGLYSVTVSNVYGWVMTPPVALSVNSVAVWGANEVGQTNMPTGLEKAVAIAAGHGHALALRADGRVVAWGDNTYGQAEVPVGLTNAVAIACGANHNLALRPDGTVVGWGRNTEGQAQIPEGLKNAVAIAGGAYHSLVLRGDGTVVAWGSPWSGQTAVPAGLREVVAIASGALHNLALRRDGTVVGWGESSSGAAAVPAGLREVVAIGAGALHSLAVKADGRVVAWGRNYRDRTDVPAGLTNAVAVVGGYVHSLALRADGSVVGWGSNYQGQAITPPAVRNAVAVAGGYYFSVALLGEGPPVRGFVLGAPVRVGEGWALSFPTQQGRVYALEYVDGLGRANWQALPLAVGAGDLLSLTDPTPTSAQRFYRVRAW
jgi:hypothetical protein